MNQPDVELAAAIVVHEECVLIVQRSMREGFLPGTWGIPCGKIDKGEDAQQAVLRELLEETGLKGTVACHAGELEFRSDWGVNRQNNYLVYPSRSEKGRDGHPDEHPAVKPPLKDQDWEWVAVGEIEKRGLDKHNLRAIRQGLKCHVLSATSGARSQP